MATELDNPSFGNFSIIDTMDGTGNPDLLKGLYDEESNTDDPDKVAPVEDKKTPPTTKKEEPKKEDKKLPPKDTNKPLKTFLNDGEEEEELEEGAEPAKKEGEEEEEGNEPEKENNTFKTISKELFELGVFSKGEGEGDVDISTPEQFLERFQLEKRRGANTELANFLGQFGEDYQAAFQAIYVKGVDPREYFTTYNQIEDIVNLDLKVEENQIAVIRQALVDQELEASEITAEIERLKSYGDLETVSGRYQKALVKKQAAKLEQIEKDSAAKVQQQKAAKTQYIQNVRNVIQDKLKTKEFDGIPLSPQTATELQDYLITDKYKSPSGELMTEFDRALFELKNPANHEKKIKVALLLKTLEKDPTLSTIQKKGVSKETSTLFADLTRQKQKSAKTESEKAKSQQSWFS
jgi:hypothetical protein